MRRVHFQPSSLLPAVAAIAQYEEADYSLTVGPSGRIPQAMHRLSIDTLTLSCSPDNHVLVGLDAYTSSAKWERRRLAAPPVDQELALVCIEPFDEHGIAPGGSDPVQYTYSEDSALLLIKISDGHVVTRIQCLSCAICGLGVLGDLIEIFVQGFNP